MALANHLIDASSVTARPLTAGRLDKRATNHLEWIDVLRGFAAMWVIVYHSRVTLWIGFYEVRNLAGTLSPFARFMAWLSIPASFGGSAVMLFFVISGFCVHLPYAGGNRALVVKNYSLRRAFRILPPYLFAVLLTCVLEWLAFVLGGPSPTPLNQIMRVCTLVQNYGTHTAQLMTNPSLWSLPVEVELYGAYLAVYVLLKTTNIRLTAAIVLILSGLASAAYVDGVELLDGNFLRFWGIWCAGALLATWLKQGGLPKFRLWNGLSLIVAAVVAILAERRQWHVGILDYLWGLVYFHVLWLALLHPGVIHRLPDWCSKLFVGLGNISYSAYLIHFPFFAFSGFLLEHFLGKRPANFLVPLLFSVLVWPLAWVFWKFCELPFHRYSKNRWPTR
jgi:peptidoglycan/LPS O-acetylase OafA/YrhL